MSSLKHHSWVTGKDNSNYLERRCRVFKEYFMLDSMEFTKGKMKERDDEVMAASRINRGTEVNYGVLTELFFKF